MARILNGVKLSDKISSKTILSNLKMLSVNQINAQAKIMDMWKAAHVEGNPLQVSKKTKSEGSMSTRSDSHIVLNEFVLSARSEKTLINDATHVWNAAPITIK